MPQNTSPDNETMILRNTRLVYDWQSNQSTLWSDIYDPREKGLVQFGLTPRGLFLNAQGVPIDTSLDLVARKMKNTMKKVKWSDVEKAAK